MEQITFIRGWRKRWIFLGCVALAIGVGYIYILKATPVYTCTSRVFVQQGDPGAIDEAERAVEQSRIFLFTQAELMKSTPILSSALGQLDTSNMKCLSGIEGKITYLREKVKVSVGDKDDIINISLDSPHPVEAAQIVNGLVDAYVTFLSMRTKTSFFEVLAILQKERDQVSEDLTSKHKAIVDFKKENETLALEYEDSNIILERLADLARAVTDAELRTLEAEINHDTIEKMVSDPVKVREFIQSKHTNAGLISFGAEHLRLHRELELDSLRRELDDLTSQVAADHRSAKEKEAKIKRIEEQLAGLDKEFVEAQLAVSLQQYRVAQHQKEELTKLFHEQRKKAINLNRQMDQISLLQSEYEQSRGHLETLEHRIRELDVRDDVGRVNVTVLEIAEPADKPSAPQRGRVLALALVLGIISGSGLSLLKGLASK